jgi:hypothetical protein
LLKVAFGFLRVAFVCIMLKQFDEPDMLRRLRVRMMPHTGDI